MKATFAALSTAAWLAGCASVGEIRDREPIRTAQSGKSVQEITTCIVGKWSRSKGLMVNTLPIEGGTAISAQTMYYSTPITWAVVDVIDRGDYRAVLLHPRFEKRQKSAQKTMDYIQACW